MSHTIDYNAYGLTEEQKEEKAIEDCKWYVGEETWAKIMEVLPEQTNRMSVEFGLSFAGLQGYPVRVLIKRYCPLIKTEEDETNCN